jgi:uncharacterized protein YecT (DUF1311 family)
VEECLKFTLWVCLVMAMATEALPVAAQTQTEMNDQAGRDYKQADRQLNDTYNALLAKLSADGKASLREAERAWIAFRDRECAFETMGSAGGSIHSMVVAQCATRLTGERIKELKDQSNCEEGDVSCGGR